MAVLKEIKNLRDLIIPSEYGEREKKVINHHVSGEFLQYLRAVTPTVMGEDREISIGDRPLSESLSLHSMNLHAALLYEDRLRQYMKDRPDFTPMLLDTAFYASDPNYSTRDFVTGLVADTLQKGIGSADSQLSHFTNDLYKITDGLSQEAQKALWAQAMEWYYWQGSSYAGQEFFTVENQVLHYVTAVGAGLPGAQDKAQHYVSQWLEPLLGRNVLFSMNMAAQVWHVVQGGQGASVQAAEPDKKSLFVGNAGDDHFVGGAKGDILIGGEGADRLEGGSGVNELAGGAGHDTYVMRASEVCRNTIYDSDGDGHLEFDGHTLQGGQRKADKVWVNEEQGILYSLTGSGANTYLLVKNKKSGHIIARIRNWTNGQLGLSMTDKAPDPQPGPGGTQSGLGLDQSGTSGYIHINAGQADKGVSLAGNSQSNSFIGSNHADHISTGDGNGNYVMAGSGSDVVIGGEGREYIRAGQAFTRPGMVDDDTVYGGPNTDMIYGGAGDDWLWGASDDDQWQRHNGQSHQRGDWISGEAGSDHIYGSSAKDVLFGGAGSDDIKGGAGDDLILGDAQYSVASRVIAQSYAGAGTRSYSWNAATQEFQQARTDGAYAMNPVVVPNGRIHEWDWQAEPHGTGYRFTGRGHQLHAAAARSRRRSRR
nr:calcium-binding protein [Ottowia sp. oral taxon 894]